MLDKAQAEKLIEAYRQAALKNSTSTARENGYLAHYTNATNEDDAREALLSALTGDGNPAFQKGEDSRSINENWVVIEALNRVSLIDIMLDAVRGTMLGKQTSAHMLDAFAKAIRSHFAKKAIATGEAQAPTPADPDLAYAIQIATYGVRKFTNVPNWKPLDTMQGVLSQIDNLLAGTPSRGEGSKGATAATGCPICDKYGIGACDIQHFRELHAAAIRSLVSPPQVDSPKAEGET